MKLQDFRCFPVKFAEYLRTFFYRTPPVVLVVIRRSLLIANKVCSGLRSKFLFKANKYNAITRYCSAYRYCTTPSPRFCSGFNPTYGASEIYVLCKSINHWEKKLLSENKNLVPFLLTKWQVLLSSDFFFFSWQISRLSVTNSSS